MLHTKTNQFNNQTNFILKVLPAVHILQIQFRLVQSNQILQDQPLLRQLLPSTLRGNTFVALVICMRRKIVNLSFESCQLHSTGKKIYDFLYLTSFYPAGMLNIGHNLVNECLSEPWPLDILSVPDFLRVLQQYSPQIVQI